MRPSPHSLCHLCTWARRLRKAFLESGTSRYADQRRNWNWQTTSWPSWSLKCNEKTKKRNNLTRLSKLVWVNWTVSALMCLCCLDLFWVPQYSVCQLAPVFQRSPGLHPGTLSSAHSAGWLWDLWICRCKWSPSCVHERSLYVHNLVL